MYHALMRWCGMKAIAMGIKTVGLSGQISVGKALAGQNFVLESLPNGDVLLKRAVVVPVNEAWAHTPEMKKRLKAARKWADNTPRKETDLDALDRAYAATRMRSV